MERIGIAGPVEATFIPLTPFGLSDASKINLASSFWSISRPKPDN
jgi:hypothetical protein